MQPDWKFIRCRYASHTCCHGNMSLMVICILTTLGTVDRLWRNNERILLSTCTSTSCPLPSTHRYNIHTPSVLTLEQRQGRQLYGFALRAELGRTLRPLLLGLPDRLPRKSVHFVHRWRCGGCRGHSPAGRDAKWEIGKRSLFKVYSCILHHFIVARWDLEYDQLVCVLTGDNTATNTNNSGKLTMTPAGTC